MTARCLDHARPVSLVSSRYTLQVHPSLSSLLVGIIAPCTQVKIVNSLDLFARPEKVAKRVAEFAGLDSFIFSEYALARKSSCDPRRRSKDTSYAYSKRVEAEPSLRKWYADHNDALSEDMGVEFHWNKRIQSMVKPGKSSDSGGRGRALR